MKRATGDSLRAVADALGGVVSAKTNYTWTEGPEYPVVRCSRCGADLDKRDIATGWCPVCGDMGAVEFLREGGTWSR